MQPFAVVSAPAGGTAERPLTAEEGGAATLDEEQLRALARLGDDLEQRLGGAAGHRVGARGRRALRPAGTTGDGMSELLERARAWVLEVHPHPRHLERTLDWAVELDPQASEALHIAAITHDIERAFPDREAGWDSAASWDDPAYIRWHQDRCAEMVAGWLREQRADARAGRRGRRASCASTRSAAGPRPTCCRPRTRSRSSRRWWAWSGGGSSPAALRASGPRASCVTRSSGSRPGLRGRASEGEAAAARRRCSAWLRRRRPRRCWPPRGWSARGGSSRWRATASRACRCSPGTPRSRCSPTARHRAFAPRETQPWGPGNEAGLGYMSELVLGTTHSGAHIDAHAHMTIGPRTAGTAAPPASTSATSGRCGATQPRSRPCGAAACSTTCPATAASPFLGRGESVGGVGAARRSRPPRGVAAGAGDVALLRTGYMRHWPDSERMAEHRGPGPDAVRRAAARGARRGRHRLRHRDLRGAARARPRRAVQPAAGPHAAADRARHLHHGEPRPRGAGGGRRARVPVRGAAAARSAAPPAR